MSTEQNYKGNDIPIQQPIESLKFEENKIFKVKRKISQIQNKAYFFEGQLNPITNQNKSLKQQIISLQRSVLISTEMLRNLLPCSNNQQRKLKIQLAGIQQISFMIKDDWLMLQQQLKHQKFIYQQKNKEYAMLQEKLNAKISEYQKKIQQKNEEFSQMKLVLKTRIAQLDNKIIFIVQEARKREKQLQQSYKKRIWAAEKLQKQFKNYRRENQEKIQNIQRANSRLKDEITKNLEQFQKSKNNMKQIYEKMMEQKLQQQKQSYEQYLNMKQEQKRKIIEDITALQEEYNAKLQENASKIEHLSKIITNQKEEVEKCKNQIWSYRQKIDQKNRQIKQMQIQLFKQKQNYAGIVKKMELKQKKYQVALDDLKQVMKKQQARYQSLISNSTGEINKLLLQNQNLTKDIKINKEKIQEIKRKLRQNDEKFRQVIQEEQYKNSSLKDQLIQKEKLFQKNIQSLNRKARLKQLELDQAIKKQRQKFDSLKKKSEFEMNYALEQNKKLIQKMKKENQEKQRQFIKKYERELADLEVRNNQYIRKMVLQQGQKLRLQEQKMQNMKKASEAMISSLQQSLNSKIAENKLLLKKCDQSEEKMLQQLQKMSKKAQLQNQKLKDQLKQEIKLFQQALKEQQVDYQKSISKMEQQIYQKEKQYKSQIDKIKQTLQKQINMLKQSNALEEIEEKYEKIIQKMKEDVKLQLLKQKQQSYLQKQKLINDHQREIEALNNQHNLQLSQISRKLQLDISKLNEDLLDEKNAHEFSRLTKQQKIQFLMLKISAFKDQMLAKQDLILDLQMDLQKKKKQIQKMDEIVAQKLKAKKQELQRQLLFYKQECELKIAQNQSKCSTRVREIQTERIKHAQNLYKQFQQMIVRHEISMNALEQKYNQLERLFQERPSRAEDLDKIKDLIQERAKIDQEMNECKKKVKVANEIVKYLNLELQNYKDNYDIFTNNQVLSPIRREVEKVRNVDNQSESDSKSYYEHIKKYKSSQKRQKRFNTQIPKSQFRLLPSLSSKKTIVQEDEDEEIDDERRLSYPTKKSLGQAKSSQLLLDDKSQQLKSNAHNFLRLISQHHGYQPVVTEVSKKKPLYGRKNRPRRGHERRNQIMIKQKTFL